MTNNTAIYWEIAQLDDPSFTDSLSLHTLAWSVSTFGGARYKPVPRRGDDVILPGRNGRRYLKKYRDAQVLSLHMWMVPLNPDGTSDDSMTLEQKLHGNWQTILRTVDVDGQFLLKKRWWENGSVHAAIGAAEFSSGMEPESSGFRQEFDLEVLMADPYFYESFPLTDLGTGDLTVQGDSSTDHITLAFTGGTNPKVTFPDGNYIRIDGTLSSTVTVDCHAATAIRSSDGRYVNGLLSHNPSIAGWPVLKPGAQHLSYTGGGSVEIAYDAAWR